jgi:DNA-binding MarR family transcriptional regulator
MNGILRSRSDWRLLPASRKRRSKSRYAVFLKSQVIPIYTKKYVLFEITRVRAVSKETIRKLSKQFDAALVTLNELRVKSGCKALPYSVLHPTLRHENAYHTAMRLFQNRRDRERHFGDRAIFGEPAWDILLDLYIHQAREDEVSVKSASLGSGAPATTALRWLNLLEEQGLLCSSEDPTDQRRRFVRLTPEGYESMTRYLEAISP